MNPTANPSGRTSPNRAATRARRGTKTYACLLLAAIAATLLPILAVLPAAHAALRSFPTAAGWVRPTGSTTYEDWGFKDCSSAYMKAHGSAHLGADSQRPQAAGDVVSTIAAGVVQRVVSWGPVLGHAVSVLSTTASGQKFVVVYGHVTPSSGIVEGKALIAGQVIGTLASIDSAHLHLGIRPIVSGIDPTDWPYGMWPCSGTASSSHQGYVDPIPWLASHPAASSVIRPCDYVGWVVGAQGTSSKYLVQTNCERAWIPTGGDYEAIVSQVGSDHVRIFASTSQMGTIKSSGRTVKAVRIDEPTISGPTSWLHHVDGVGSRAYQGDYVWTTSAAGKSYVTNEGVWTLKVSAPGVYRVQAFIPNRLDAWAGVVYRLYDSTTLRQTKSLRQADHTGWTTVGTITVTTSVVKVRLRDNEGTGPYNDRFAFDGMTVVPVR